MRKTFVMNDKYQELFDKFEKEFDTPEFGIFLVNLLKSYNILKEKNIDLFILTDLFKNIDIDIYSLIAVIKGYEYNNPNKQIVNKPHFKENIENINKENNFNIEKNDNEFNNNKTEHNKTTMENQLEKVVKNETKPKENTQTKNDTKEVILTDKPVIINKYTNNDIEDNPLLKSNITIEDD